MLEVVATIILFSGLIGMGTILFRKIPVLVQLPETPAGLGLKLKIQKIVGKIKSFKFFKIPSFDILLQKILSKIRILTLKIERKISTWLQKMREKSQKKEENDQYWQKIKESIEEDKSQENKNNSPT